MWPYQQWTHAPGSATSIPDTQDGLACLVIDLKAIRTAAGLTLQEMSDRLGLEPRSGRTSVKQMEDRRDILLSRLVNYLEKVGATAELHIEVAGEVFKIPLV